MEATGKVDMLPLGSLAERLTFSVLGAGAGLTTLNGLSLLVATLPMLAYSRADSHIDALSRAVLSPALTSVVCGSIAGYLVHSRRPLLPNERQLGTRESALSGWALALAVSLPLLALVTLCAVAPLRSLWREMFVMLRESHLVDGVFKAPEMSGLVLLPVIAVFSVPLLEFVAAGVCMGSAVVLFPLVWVRSVRLPRALIACVLLQAALVFAGSREAAIARGVGAWFAGEVGGRGAAFMRTDEIAHVLEVVERYTSVVISTSRSLTWVVILYAAWLAPLLLSREARASFAVRSSLGLSVGTPSSRPVGSMAPDARRRFYEESVNTLEDATASTSMHRSAFGLMTITILIGALLVLFALLGVLKPGAAPR